MENIQEQLENDYKQIKMWEFFAEQFEKDRCDRNPFVNHNDYEEDVTGDKYYAYTADDIRAYIKYLRTKHQERLVKFLQDNEKHWKVYTYMGNKL